MAVYECCEHCDLGPFDAAAHAEPCYWGCNA